MNHPTREEWMSYLYDELTAEEHSSLAAHLAVCPDCKARINDWRAAGRNLDAWQLPARPARVPLQRPMVRWAAAAALILGIGIGVGRFATPADGTNIPEVSQGGGQCPLVPGQPITFQRLRVAGIGVGIESARKMLVSLTIEFF